MTKKRRRYLNMTGKSPPQAQVAVLRIALSLRSYRSVGCSKRGATVLSGYCARQLFCFLLRGRLPKTYFQVISKVLLPPSGYGIVCTREREIRERTTDSPPIREDVSSSSGSSRGWHMKAANTMDAQLLGKLARFLDDHPGFSPTFSSNDAILCGFCVGNSMLTIDEMQQFLHSLDQAPQPLLLAAYTEWPVGI